MSEDLPDQGSVLGASESLKPADDHSGIQVVDPDPAPLRDHSSSQGKGADLSFSRNRGISGTGSSKTQTSETHQQPSTRRSSFRKSWDGHMDSLYRHLSFDRAVEKPRSASEGGECPRSSVSDLIMESETIENIAIELITKSLSTIRSDENEPIDPKAILRSKLESVAVALKAAIVASAVCFFFIILLIISDTLGKYHWDGKVQAYYFMGSLMTLISGVYVVYTYWVLGPLNRHPASLHVWGTMCDMLFAIPMIAQFFDSDYDYNGVTSSHRDESSCKVYAFLTQISLFGSVTWFFLLSWDLFLAIRQPFGNNLLQLTRYHICAWFFTFLTGFILLVGRFEGISHVCLCWIESRAPGEFTYGMWILYYFSVCFYYSFSVGVLFYCAYKWNMWSRRSQTKESSDDEEEDSSGQVMSKTMEIRKLVMKQNAFHIMVYGAYFAIVFILYYTYDNVRSYDGSDVICDPEDQNAIVLLKVFALLISGKGVLDGIVWYYKSYLGQINKEVLANAEISEQMRKDVMQCTRLGICDTAEMASGHRIQDIRNQRYFQSLLEMNVRGKSTQYSFVFRSYAMLVFRHLREFNGITTESYLQSLTKAAVKDTIGKLAQPEHSELKESFSEGRSGSFLYFSSDRRFIIKTLSHSEAKLLLDVLKSYHRHMTSHRDTLITRLYGLHSIKIYGMTMYFVVMENVVHLQKDRTAMYTFDMKGSWIDREVGVSQEPEKPLQKTDGLMSSLDVVLKVFQSSNEEITVRPEMANEAGKKRKIGTLKDIDFEKLFGTVNVGPTARQQLIQQLKIDTEFFRRLNIMDYSLLLVISEGFAVTHIETGDLPSSSKDAGDAEYVPFFRRYCGGIPEHSSNPGLTDGLTQRVFHLGIIDLLQEYNLNKKTERWIKVHLRRKDPAGVSCIAPLEYAERFCRMIDRMFVGSS